MLRLLLVDPCDADVGHERTGLQCRIARSRRVLGRLPKPFAGGVVVTERSQHPPLHVGGAGNRGDVFGLVGQGDGIPRDVFRRGVSTRAPQGLRVIDAAASAQYAPSRFEVLG